MEASPLTLPAPAVCALLSAHALCSVLCFVLLSHTAHLSHCTIYPLLLILAVTACDYIFQSQHRLAVMYGSARNISNFQTKRRVWTRRGTSRVGARPVNEWYSTAKGEEPSTARRPPSLRSLVMATPTPIRETA